MKILIFSNNIGGILSFRMEVIEALRNKGNEVCLAIPLNECDSFERLSKIGCRHIPLNLVRRGTNVFDELKLLKEFKEIVKKEKPDVVFSYTIKPNIYASVACRKAGIPIICNITGLGSALENPGILQLITVNLYRWAFKKTDYVFFQNQFSIDFFKKHNIHLNKFKCIWGSGVNLDRFKCQDYPDESNGIHFVFISRLFKLKGIGQYLNAARELQKKYKKLHFHILGSHDDKYYSELVESLNKEGVVEYHGEQSDVRPFLTQCHCLVHPSYYPEGMSNVLQEASATGRPCITTDKPGCGDVVDDGITGFIVKQQSSEDLIEKMDKFINLTWDNKKSMGHEARLKVERQFDRKIVVQEYLDAVDYVLRNK